MCYLGWKDVKEKKDILQDQGEEDKLYSGNEA